MRNYQRLTHSFEPVYDENSRVLILGSFPSVKSRETGFYYGNPQNRFWKVISGLFHTELPGSIAEKRSLLLAHHIAVWDVIRECDIIGSDDSSIKNVQVNELSRILEQSSIVTIYGNGQKASKLYKKYQEEYTGRNIISLPSTSPANAACSLERLLLEWSVICRDISEGNENERHDRG